MPDTSRISANIKPKTVLLVKEKNNIKHSERICSSLVTYFLTILFALGLNFGIVKYLKKEFRSTVFFFYVFSCAMTLTTLIIPAIVTETHDSWTYFNVAQYLAYLFTLHFTKYNICDLIVDIQSIDNVIMSKSKIGMFSLIYCYISYVFKMIFVIQKCLNNDCLMYLIPLPIYGFFMTGLDVLTWCQVIISFYFYLCIKSICVSLKMDLKISLKIYRDTVDCYDKIKPLYTALVVVELLSSIPKYFNVLWHLLSYIRENVETVTIISSFVYLFHTLAQVCGPAIVVEIVKGQIDTVKRELSHQIITEKDAEKRADAECLLQFMEGRPILNKLFNVIPIDLHLPMSLLNLMTSYFIVIIQFSHLYD